MLSTITHISGHRGGGEVILLGVGSIEHSYFFLNIVFVLEIILNIF